MLFILAEANAFNTSGTYNEFPNGASGRWPHLGGAAGGRPQIKYVQNNKCISKMFRIVVFSEFNKQRQTMPYDCACMLLESFLHLVLT